jgi:hypothetical protein
MFKRNDGFYWVNTPEFEWVIAYWQWDSWWLVGGEFCVTDYYFNEIDENKIERNLGT